MKEKFKSSFYNIYKNKDGINEVFNTFTKADVIFDDWLFDCLNDGNFENVDSDTITELLNLGFIVPSYVDEFQIIKNSYIDYRKKKEKLLITLVPTFMCNFRCKYCFEGSTPKSNNQIIDYETLKKYAELNFDKFKHVHITLFGGEPLLCHEKNVDFYKYIKKMCELNGQTYSSSIATNAYLLNEKCISELIEICNCQTFQITIDGCRRTHNMLRGLAGVKPTYDVVLNNFRTLLKYNSIGDLNIVLRVNLFNNTIDEVNELLEEFTEDEKQRFSIYFRYIYNTKEFKEKNENEINLNEFYELAKKQGFSINGNRKFSFYHCEGDGAEEQIHILPNLKVYKCINDMTYEKSYIGDINPHGEILFNDKIHIWNDYSFFEDKKCRECKYLPMCWGGCPLIYKKSNRRVCIHEKVMEENEKKGEIINA